MFLAFVLVTQVEGCVKAGWKMFAPFDIQQLSETLLDQRKTSTFQLSYISIVTNFQLVYIFLWGVVFSLNWMIGLTTTLWQNRANFAMFASLPVSISECRVVDAVNKNWIVRVSAKFVEHGGNDFICLPTLISETNVCLTFCCKKIWVGSTGISRFGYVFPIGIFVFAMIIRLVYGLKKTVCCWTQQDGIIAQRHDGVFLTNQIRSVWNHMFFFKEHPCDFEFCCVFIFAGLCWFNVYSSMHRFPHLLCVLFFQYV